MSDAHRRKKQPDVLRPQLLQSASQLAIEEGLASVTLDAVASRAGVSKGGLQHHFPNKQALLDALFAEAVAAFNADIAAASAADADAGAHANADDKGRAARAYIQATVQEPKKEGPASYLHLLLAVMLTDADARERWSAQIAEITRPDPLPEAQAARLMICRLAADGLWIAQLLGYQSMGPSLKAEVLRQLDQMTRGLEQ